MAKRTYIAKKLDGTLVKLTVREPKSFETDQADIEYSKAFVKSLADGLPTVKSMERILKESGAWTEKDEALITDIIKKGASLEDELKREGISDSDKKRIEDTLGDLREELSSLRKEKNSYFEHTAESKASDAQRDYLICCVTRYADTDEQVWKDTDALKKEEDGDLVFRAVYEYLAVMNDVDGLPDDKLEEEKVETEPKVEPAMEV